MEMEEKSSVEESAIEDGEPAAKSGAGGPSPKSSAIGITSKSLIFVVILSFLIFGFCVVKFAIGTAQINQTVLALTESIANNQPHSLSEYVIESFSQLQAFYRDASNFQIVSLLYVLISSVLIGALGLYVQEQRKRVDEADAKREKLEERISAIGKSADEADAKRVKLEERISAIGKSADDREREAKKQQGELQLLTTGLNAQKNAMNEIIRIQSLSEFTQRLGVSLMYAATINILCSGGESVDISVQASLLRTHLKNLTNDIRKSRYKEWIKDLTKDEKGMVIQQVNSIHDMLAFALSKNHEGFKETAFSGFAQYCEELLDCFGTKRE